MLLMAWGGEPLTRSQWEDDSKAKKEMKKSHVQIRQLGVSHGDVRRQNFCVELGAEPCHHRLP